MNIVSFGGGTNSTAMIIGMYLHKIPVDLILFADTGGEQPHTYEFIRVFNSWLEKHGLPTITPVFYTDKDGNRLTLEAECLRLHALPSIAYGFKKCSIQGIITVIMTIGSVVVPALLAGFEAFSAGISAVMSAIQGFFQGLITFITGVFSGSWSQAWEGIKQIFGSAFDGLVALCKAPLNAVIAIINKAISGINGLGLTIPKWVPILGGKSFSVNIPTLPMLARGGFTDGVSIAGEAGTEAVISFQRGVRSDNINTWTQAGRMLGVSGEQAAVAAGVPYADGGGAVELATIEATQGNNAVELQEIDTGKPQPEQGGSGTPDGGGQVVFAPQIVVQGNADRAVLESVLDDAQQRFELWYEQMMRRKARTAY